MEDGPPEFPSGFTCLMVLRNRIHEAEILSFTGLSPSAGGLSSPLQLGMRFFTSRRDCSPFQPGPVTPVEQRLQAITLNWFGLFPVRSPLLGESLLISIPPGTEMFHFPGYTSVSLCHLTMALVSLFGDPRIRGCLRLPVAYRSSLRPSSCLCA